MDIDNRFTCDMQMNGVLLALMRTDVMSSHAAMVFSMDSQSLVD